MTKFSVHYYDGNNTLLTIEYFNALPTSQNLGDALYILCYNKKAPYDGSWIECVNAYDVTAKLIFSNTPKGIKLSKQKAAEKETKIVNEKMEKLYKEWQDQSVKSDGLTDAENPAFLFSDINTSLLSLIASGQIDGKWLATRELQNRGCDEAGIYIGFKKK